MQERIRVDVVTPARHLMTAEADEVVLPGGEGYLGVRPGHAPLLTSLGIGELMLRTGTTQLYASLSWGFAEVLPDRVTVLAEIAERAEEIDTERAEAARRRAEERITSGDPSWDLDRARVALTKAMARLQVARKRAS